MRLVLGSLLLVSLAGCASEPVLMQAHAYADSSRELVDGASWIQGPDGEHVKHGSFLSSWPNGETRATVSYHQGVPHGDWRQWFDDGQLAAEGRFDLGENHGEWTEWYRSGERRSVSHWEFGKLHGPYLR